MASYIVNQINEFDTSNSVNIKEKKNKNTDSIISFI